MLQTVAPKTADQLLGRLRETERILIRGANTADRLEHLRLNDFAGDGPVSAEAMAEVKAKLDAQYAEYNTKPWWQTQTWAL
jgi:hypothetical protein